MEVLVMILSCLVYLVIDKIRNPSQYQKGGDY